MWHSTQLVLLHISIFTRNKYRQVVESMSPLIPFLYWPSLIISLFFCVYWQFKLPTAGVAIGALGAVGVLVAIKGEKLHEGHKVMWAFITLIFLVTEIRAIKNDRADLDTKQVTTINTIVSGYKQEMSQNQTNFDTTMQKFDRTISGLKGLTSAGKQAQVEQRREFGGLLSKQEDLFTRQLELAEFLNGKLLPASDPMPAHTCLYPIQKDDVALFLGTNAMVTRRFPYTIVQVHGKAAISIDRTDDGLLVLSVDMRDAANRIVARLNKNGFVVNGNYALFMLRPDKSTVIIEDQFGEEMLHARFLNRQAFSLRGILPYGGTNIRLEMPNIQHSCSMYGGAIAIGIR